MKPHQGSQGSKRKKNKYAGVVYNSNVSELSWMDEIVKDKRSSKKLEPEITEETEPSEKKYL